MMEEQYILADQYYLKKGKYDAIEKEYGVKSVPVDNCAGLVIEKEGNCLSPQSAELQAKLQYNIRCRFDMKSKEDYDYNKSY